MPTVRFERDEISGRLLRFLDAENACAVSGVEFALRSSPANPLPRQGRLVHYDDRLLVIRALDTGLVHLYPMAEVQDVRVDGGHSWADQTR